MKAGNRGARAWRSRCPAAKALSAGGANQPTGSSWGVLTPCRRSAEDGGRGVHAALLSRTAGKSSKRAVVGIDSKKWHPPPGKLAPDKSASTAEGDRSLFLSPGLCQGKN